MPPGPPAGYGGKVTVTGTRAAAQARARARHRAVTCRRVIAAAGIIAGSECHELPRAVPVTVTVRVTCGDGGPIVHELELSKLEMALAVPGCPPVSVRRPAAGRASTVTLTVTAEPVTRKRPGGSLTISKNAFNYS